MERGICRPSWYRWSSKICLMVLFSENTYLWLPCAIAQRSLDGRRSVLGGVRFNPLIDHKSYFTYYGVLLSMKFYCTKPRPKSNPCYCKSQQKQHLKHFNISCTSHCIFWGKKRLKFNFVVYNSASPSHSGVDLLKK